MEQGNTFIEVFGYGFIYSSSFYCLYFRDEISEVSSFGILGSESSVSFHT